VDLNNIAISIDEQLVATGLRRQISLAEPWLVSFSCWLFRKELLREKTLQQRIRFLLSAEHFLRSSRRQRLRGASLLFI